VKDIIRLILVLTCVSVVAGLMLSVTNKVTATPIAIAARKTTVDALSVVLPAFDNQPDQNVFKVTEADKEWQFYVARKSGVYAGAAFIASSANGYGGEIRLMIGITDDGAIKAIQILEQRETPGLGTKITNDKFKNQFAGKDVAATTWAVTKDGGQVDAITGATISSRAVAEAIRSGAAMYTKHLEAIKAQGQ